MRHLPYFSVARSGGEGHLDARGENKAGEEGRAPTQFICKARLVQMRSNIIDNAQTRWAFEEEEEEEEEGERRFARCDDSRREEDECGEQKLSDVREAGSKKAPQIHAINNVSPHT